MNTSIQKVKALEILDSRGFPTVWASVTFSDGTCDSASVPSGASVGKNEALELRDQNSNRFFWKRCDNCRKKH